MTGLGNLLRGLSVGTSSRLGTERVRRRSFLPWSAVMEGTIFAQNYTDRGRKRKEDNSQNQ